MTSYSITRDVYGPITEGGPIERRRLPVRRLSAPRERTLTELSPLSPLSFMLEDERDFLSALTHEPEESVLEEDCGE